MCLLGEKKLTESAIENNSSGEAYDVNLGMNISIFWNYIWDFWSNI